MNEKPILKIALKKTLVVIIIDISYIKVAVSNEIVFFNYFNNF